MIHDEIAALHSEQVLIQLQIDTTPYCGHWPIGSMASCCQVCGWHQRCDEIDSALDRLLTHAKVRS